VADAHRGHRPAPRYGRGSQCQACGVDSQLRRVVLAQGKHSYYNLHLVADVRHKQRAYRAVYDAAVKYPRLGGPPLAADILRAQYGARRVVALLKVDRKRKV